MRTTLSTLTLLRPRTVGEALALLRDEGPLEPLAGGTDLYVGLNAGALTATRFLDLWRLEPLRRISARGPVLSIGALATYSSLVRSRLVNRRLPMLVQASREVGGVQIQNRGTLGGNVANGSPAGDTLPVLAAAEATVVLASAGAQRRVPFLEFFTGYRASVRRADELLVAFEIGPLEGAQWFRKVGTRAAQAISKVVIAAVRGYPPRIALGSVAPTPVRLPKTETALAAGAPIDDAARIAEAEISPIDDVRSTAAYRRRVTGNLVRQFWTEAAGARSG